MPRKEQALALADRADSLAIACNAANTLVRSDGGWDAYNTDVFGIQMAVAKKSFRSVSVIGTGATARSAIVAMQELGKEVTLWGRTKSVATQLSAEFDISITEKFHQAAAADLVIATVPKGALDEHLDQIRTAPSGLLLDVVYDGWPTQAATKWGLRRSISGLEMLLWQAIGQQRLFAGNDLDEALPREKDLLEVLRNSLSMAN
jgi:shikimate dehydrogenase